MALQESHQSCCVTSLFETCVTFVATHLDLVENFIGFPSQVGEKIYHAALDTNQFADSSNLNKFVELFADAFGEDLLTHLNVSDQHLGVNFYIDSILLFHGLVQLDVSNCGLGDDHELLANLTNLYRLEVLLLADNGISDTGIQRMTAPYRMFQRGPTHLRVLSLAGNVNLSVSCLKYLTQFTYLDSVDLSDCQQCKIGKLNGWSLSEGVSIESVSVVTKGWAASLLHGWMLRARQKSKKQPKPRAIFYQRHKQKSSIETELPNDLMTSIKERQRLLIARRVRNNQAARECMLNKDINTMRDGVTEPGEMDHLLTIYQSDTGGSRLTHQATLNQCLDSVAHDLSESTASVKKQSCSSKLTFNKTSKVNNVYGSALMQNPSVNSSSVSIKEDKKTSKQQTMTSFLDRQKYMRDKHHDGGNQSDHPQLDQAGNSLNKVEKENNSSHYSSCDSPGNVNYLGGRKPVKSLLQKKTTCKTTCPGVGFDVGADIGPCTLSQQYRTPVTSDGAGQNSRGRGAFIKDGLFDKSVTMDHKETESGIVDRVFARNVKTDDRSKLPNVTRLTVSKGRAPEECSTRNTSHKRKKIKLIRRSDESFNLTGQDCEPMRACDSVVVDGGRRETYGQDESRRERNVKRQKTGSLLSALDAFL